ncbi:Hypothetical protein UVM_LOCUS412 [uncultured virus]|nr:Hypothetical protein UVM_LOCUS412 [uncultured virus]
MHRKIPGLFNSLRLRLLNINDGARLLSPAFCASFVAPYNCRDRIFSGLHVTQAHEKDDQLLRSSLLDDILRSGLLMYGSKDDQLRRCATGLTWPAVHVRAHGSEEELEAGCVHADFLEPAFRIFKGFNDAPRWWRNSYVSRSSPLLVFHFTLNSA